MCWQRRLCYFAILQSFSVSFLWRERATDQLLMSCFFAVLFLVLGLCFEPFERLMIHSFTFFKTGKRAFILMAGTVQLLFLWMTAYTADQMIHNIWLSTTEEMILAAVFLILDKCNSALPS